MPRLKTCFVAEAVIRDADSNLLSIFNLMEAIRPSSFPFFIPRLVFLSVWRRDAGDIERYPGEFTAVLDGDILAQMRLELDFQGNVGTRAVVNLNGFIVPQPGSLVFRINLQGGIQAEYAVELAPPPVQVVGAPASPAAQL